MSTSPRAPRHRRPPGADRGPRRLGEVLDTAVSRLGSPAAPAPPTGLLSAVFTRWEEIAGPRLAVHVRPLELSGGTLVVAADHPAWATEARSLGAAFLARVQEVSGEAPAALRVVVREPPAGPGTHWQGGPVG